MRLVLQSLAGGLWCVGQAVASASGALGVLESGQVALGVEGGRAAAAGGGDGLAVGVVDQVAAGEDARQVGQRRAALHQDVALVVEVDLALDQLAARVVADGDEQAGDGDVALLAGRACRAAGAR